MTFGLLNSFDCLPIIFRRLDFLIYFWAQNEEIIILNYETEKLYKITDYQWI